MPDQPRNTNLPASLLSLHGVEVPKLFDFEVDL